MGEAETLEFAQGLQLTVLPSWPLALVAFWLMFFNLIVSPSQGMLLLLQGKLCKGHMSPSAYVHSVSYNKSPTNVKKQSSFLFLEGLSKQGKQRSEGLLLWANSEAGERESSFRQQAPPPPISCNLQVPANNFLIIPQWKKQEFPLYVDQAT